MQQLIDSDAADEHQSARSKSKAQSSQGHGRAVSLKRVEALIEEGERQAFAFPVETKYLAEKRQRARDWLEKLKKNFQIRSGGSLSRASLRKGASSADNNQMPAEKMTLSDMKMMVEEGNLLLEDPEGDQSELQANRTTQARELNKAQNAVSIAEEWLSRARELLAESYLSLDDDYPQKRQAQRDQARLERAANRAARAVNNAISSGESMDEVTQMEVNGKGDEEDDGDEDDEEQDVKEMLRDMLGEADEMPVQLDEAAVLRVHLRALDWVVKARKVLPSPTVSTSVNTSEMDLESKQKPIFVDAQKLLTEIQK